MSAIVQKNENPKVTGKTEESLLVGVFSFCGRCGIDPAAEGRQREY